ncbi:hypothetical protein Tco_0533783 [Tanacetum coccineum]
MSSMQEDIQCAGSDTRPPMLDRTDFESWQQRIRLYCLGKDNGENIMKSIKEGPFHMGTVSDDNGENIMKSIKEGPFQMGTVSDVISGGTGCSSTGPVRASVLNDFAEEKERYKAEHRANPYPTSEEDRTEEAIINPGQAKPSSAKSQWNVVQYWNEEQSLFLARRTEDTLELAEITRNRMRLKMQSPLYDNNRKKAETLAPKPISALTVYPPNTPVKLVPRILPTKSQVKINLYVLTQLFTEFDKTCKTRITPTGITEGERGFEQTKRCYLTEVIPFFKTLKEHFVGVQTALFKEVKEMEEIFDQMNNEVDKNTVDKQCAEIEKKNLLIENENLIVNCLSTQLLYDVEKSRCLDLEADMSKVHDESKLISKLEREYLNLQLKVELEKVKQHYKELYDSIKITRAHTSEKTSTMLNEIECLKAQLRSKEPCFTSDYVKPKVLGLNKTVRFIRTDNGTEFVNQDNDSTEASAGQSLEANTRK